MSQPSTPFNGAPTDAFLSSMEQGHFPQFQLKDSFLSNNPDQPIFSSTNSEVLDDLDFTFDGASLAQIGSSNPSTISTPDFSNYDFGQQSSVYPTPAPNSPHPYPLEHPQAFYANTDAAIPTFDQRPLPFLSHTNTVFHHPAQPPQTYVRRRSLSHGDAERIAAANTIPNPTFVRLQAPRARSATPEEKRRSGPYPQHGRSASQGPVPRGRPMKPTSTPNVLHGRSLVDGMLRTPIGTPLNELMEEDGDPIIRHMTRPDQLARSRQIIEIGAMAVVKRSKLDPRLAPEITTDNHERILRKIEEVERHLEFENGDSTDALRGCVMIREALAKKRGVEGIVKVESFVKDAEDEGPDLLDAPSKVFSEVNCDMYGGGNGGNDLMALLMDGNDHHNLSLDGE